MLLAGCSDENADSDSVESLSTTPSATGTMPGNTGPKLPATVAGPSSTMAPEMPAPAASPSSVEPEPAATVPDNVPPSPSMMPTAPSPNPSSTMPETPIQPEPEVVPPADDDVEPEPTAPSPTPTVQEPTLPPNPSGLPEPGDGGIARPAGTAGGLQVLDWAGFEAAVTYTFDDSNTTQIQNFDRLLGLEVPFTFYVQTGKTEASNTVWAQALAAGHELGNHTQSHQGSGNNLGPDTDAASQFLQETFSTVAYTMAAPNGSTDYIEVARSRFLINRGVSPGQISPNGNSDPLNLNGDIPPTGAGADYFIGLTDTARSNGRWQIVTIHGFQPQINGEYQPVDLDGFVQAVEYGKSLGDIWIGTMVDVGAYWLGQKAFSAASPQGAAGAEQTWAWTLPEHFPPDRYLRVVVDGGTLSQDGVNLPWNEHGFYEVALDAGSLTLTP